MPYQIVFMKNEQEVAGTPWSGDFESAKKHAVAHRQINKADRVEVRDDNGSLLFHDPRTLRPA